MHVRTAVEDDVEAIRGVVEASWRTDYPEILSRERAEAGIDEWYDTDSLRDAVDERRTVLLVAVDESESVVGFVHALLDREVGHVFRLYVHPDHREAGVGTELFESVRETLVDRGADRVRALVLAENTPGNEFYQSLGLEQVDAGETTVGGESYTENVYSVAR